MPETATVHALPNGLTLLIEPMTGVKSAALALWVPSGAVSDPAGGIGTAGVLAEMTMRGAGDRTSRELSDALDRLGVQRESSAGLYHTRYYAAATAANLLAALPLYADVIQRPRLEEADFEPSRQLSLQELSALDDDPRGLALIEVRKRHWPDPLGRNTIGEKADLDALTLAACRRALKRGFTPAGTMIGIAGDVESTHVIQIIARYFGEWSGDAIRPIHPALIDATSDTFIEQPSEQTHIGIACPYVTELSEDYYVARVAAEVLSGGSSGRLFTEIREVKALCYSVGTSYAPLLDRASLIGYAGTSNDRAQATLDAFLEELHKFARGVSMGEVERAKIGLTSGTVMSGESTRARAGNIVSDFFSRGRVRPLSEIVEKLDAVTHAQVDDFVRRRPLGPFTVVTVGPNRLSVP